MLRGWIGTEAIEDVPSADVAAEGAGTTAWAVGLAVSASVVATGALVAGVELVVVVVVVVVVVMGAEERKSEDGAVTETGEKTRPESILAG